MRKFILCLSLLVVMPVLGYGQFDQQKFKKEAAQFEKAINGVVDAVFPQYGLREKAKATYLEGYGPVFFMEVELERPANPFFSQDSPAEVKQNIERRQKEMKEKMSDLLKQKFPELKSAGDSGTLSIVVYLYNTNPAYVPNLPSQIVFTAKKQDTAVEVTVHEYSLDTLRQ